MADPCVQQDISSVTLVFLGKRCAGNPGDNFPVLYESESTPAIGSGSTSLSFRDTALAYYNAPTAGDPTNKSTLDNLSKQFGADFLQWLQFSGDQTLVGTCGVPPVPLYDQIIFDYYDDGVCRTRLTSAPLMSHPRELGHYDHAADCILTAFPCIYFYGPPRTATQIARYSLCLEDGRLFGNFIQMDNT